MTTTLDLCCAQIAREKAVGLRMEESYWVRPIRWSLRSTCWTSATSFPTAELGVKVPSLTSVTRTRTTRDHSFGEYPNAEKE